MHRDRGRTLAHVAASARDPDMACQPGPVWTGDAEPDRPDRLLLAAPAGTGDTGDTDSDVGAQP